MSQSAYEIRAREMFERVHNRHQFLQYRQTPPVFCCVEGGSDILGIGPLVWLDDQDRVCLDVHRCFGLPEKAREKQELIQIRIVNADGEDELTPPIPRAAFLPLTNPELSPVIALRQRFKVDEELVSEDRILSELSEALGRLFLKQKLDNAKESWLCGTSIDAVIIRRGIIRHFYYMFTKLREHIADEAFERCETDRAGDSWLLETASVALLHPCLSDYGGMAIDWFIENKPYNSERSRVAHLPRYVRRAEECLEMQP